MISSIYDWVQAIVEEPMKSGLSQEISPEASKSAIHDANSSAECQWKKAPIIGNTCLCGFLQLDILAFLVSICQKYKA